MDAIELEKLPDDSNRYELVKGELQVMSPAGGRHGRVALRISLLLGYFVDVHQLGVVLAAETGFRIMQDPDTVLAPDVAFVSQDRYDTIADEARYIPFAPDLAVEVMSPSDSFATLILKARSWLDAGTKLVLLVDPEKECIHACSEDGRIQEFKAADKIDCSSAVPGWCVVPSDVF